MSGDVLFLYEHYSVILKLVITRLIMDPSGRVGVWDGDDVETGNLVPELTLC